MVPLEAMVGTEGRGLTVTEIPAEVTGQLF
jgi:hypothetical protein